HRAGELRMSGRLPVGLLAAVATGAAVGMIPAGALGGAREASTHAVTLRNIRFHPGTLTVRRGDSVTWLWRERTLHNVPFAHSHSRTQASGSYSLRFSRRGTFAYFCSIHVAQGMRGRIIVR